MTKCSKAVTQMRKEGIDAVFGDNGVIYVPVEVNGKLFEFELSHSDIEKWADKYDEAETQEIQNNGTISKNND